MMTGRAIALTAAAALLLTGISAECAHCAGWRLNLTASEPRGFYRLRPIIGSPPPRGALIALCPPAWVRPTVFPFYMAGACPGGGRTLLKTVVGIPGDRVEVSSMGVRINGVMLPESAPKLWSERFPEIRLPHWRGMLVLRPQQYWVYGRGERPSFAARSFDSRYFGPVLASQVRGLVIQGANVMRHPSCAADHHTPMNS